MRRISIARLLASALAALTFSAPAMAQNTDTGQNTGKDSWTYFPVRNGVYGWNSGDVSVDPATGAKTVLVFMYFHQPQMAPMRGGGEDTVYVWRFEKLRYVCGARTIEFLGGDFFSAERRRLASAVPEKPIPVPAGKPEEIGYKLVCDNRAFPEEVMTADIVAAMDGAEALPR